MLLTILIDTFLDALDAGVVRSRGVVIIAIDVEIGSIRSDIVANLIM